MPRISKAAQEAAKQQALDFLKQVKAKADARKQKERVDILAGNLGEKADYVTRIAVTGKAQRILNRLSMAIREGRLDASMSDKEKVREIVGEALTDYKASLLFQNALRTAYNAGRVRYQRADDTRPQWLYRTMRDSQVRPAHKAIDGVLLPKGHAWWGSHYPPNGHNCRCRVDALTAKQAAELVKIAPRVKTEPPKEPEVAYVDKVSGKTLRTPASVDPGWAGTPDDSPDALGKLLERQIALMKNWTLPEKI